MSVNHAIIDVLQKQISAILQLEQAEQLTKMVEKEVEEAEHLRIKEATNLLFNNPQKFFRDDKQPKQ